MATIHGLASHGEGGLRGMQAAQRDWSPFITHFTSYSAMQPVRTAISRGVTPQEMKNLLLASDAQSFGIVQLIAQSGTIRTSSPSQKDSIPECICLSECSLPGLLSHCERFGRFGFVFLKEALYQLGARPCTYVDADNYALIATHGRNALKGSPQHRMFGLANVYRPRGEGQVQDYTHEREWRMFDPIDLAQTLPTMLLAPSAYDARLRPLFPRVPHVIPIDLLFEWGV